jgi:hypothetical protein
MARATDKVILTNATALKSKYGAQGYQAIQSAVSALIRADNARGLESRVIALDDAEAMRALSASAVANSADPKQNKDAVDAIYGALAPDYLMILGSSDVIPHQDLKNPLYAGPHGDDPDEFAYGDLPYACEAPYSQQPENFVGATRVVGRLPDVTGGNDPSYLVSLLKIAAGYKSTDQKTFMNCFDVTAQIWQASSRLSVTNIFGDAKNLQDVPPNNYKWKPSQLSRLSHFFNCHGAAQSPQFYGQPASGAASYPPAMDAAYVDGKISEGTVVAAECCYGGQLYALSQLVTQISLCNTYLANKCYGFFASTTIAYGPPKGNGQADYICQYFLQGVATGASLGRAALQARQRFVKTASPPDPSDIKTLSQFNLYGDPSVTPVAVTKADMHPAPEKRQTKRKVKGKAFRSAVFLAERVERRDRRRQLFKEGEYLATNEVVPRRTTRRATRGVASSIRTRARDLGWEDGNLLSFQLRRPSKLKSEFPRELLTAAALPTGYHILFKKMDKKDERTGVTRIIALVGKEVNGKLVSVSEIQSR